MIFNVRVIATYPFFFLLESYQLSTIESLFLDIYPLFKSFILLCIIYLEVFNHLSFLILASIEQPRVLSIFQPWAVWHKVSA